MKIRYNTCKKLLGRTRGYEHENIHIVGVFIQYGECIFGEELK